MREVTVPPTWRERLESIAGRRRDSWLVAAVAGAVVVGALALWARGAPAEVAPPATPDTQGGAPAVLPSAEPPGSPAAEVMLVHVAGAVRRPGLYELPGGARVADAIDAARGPLARADLDQLNLAEPLTDGQKVDVPRRGETSPQPSATSVAGDDALGGGLVNINTADQAALEAIPEVGPVTAAAIIEYREQIGGFSSIEQLLDVSGIGPATLEAVRPYVTV